MKLINLTPHPIVIICPPYKPDSELITIPVSGQIASCGQKTIEISKPLFDGGYSIPITRTIYSKANLPEPEFDTLFIVSEVVAKTHPDRQDLLITNGTVRDSSKRVIGCKSLSLINSKTHSSLIEEYKSLIPFENIAYTGKYRQLNG